MADSSLVTDIAQPLSTTIQPGNGVEQFHQWVSESLGHIEPDVLGPMVNEALSLFKARQMFALPINQFLKASYPQLNSALVRKEGDTLKLYLGVLDTGNTLENRFVVMKTPTDMRLQEFEPALVDSNLSLLARSIRKATSLHNTYIEGNGLSIEVLVGLTDSSIRAHLMPITSRDSIGIGGGLRTVFTPNLDSTLESIQLHMEYQTFDLKPGEPFEFTSSSIRGEFNEIDMVQYLIAQQKLDTLHIQQVDFDSLVVKYILRHKSALMKNVDQLKHFSGYRNDLLAAMGKINRKREHLKYMLDLAENIYIAQGGLMPTPKRAYWKSLMNNMKKELEKLHERIEKNLQGITHAKVLTELELFTNVWHSKAPMEYSFVLKRKCFCSSAFAGPFVVEIENREVKDVKHMKGKSAEFQKNKRQAGVKSQLSTTSHFGSYSLDGLIREISNFIDQAKPHIVEIDYNETYGYPNKIKFDPNVFIDGDELTISVGALHIPE